MTAPAAPRWPSQRLEEALGAKRLTRAYDRQLARGGRFAPVRRGALYGAAAVRLGAAPWLGTPPVPNASQTAARSGRLRGLAAACHEGSRLLRQLAVLPACGIAALVGAAVGLMETAFHEAKRGLACVLGAARRLDTPPGPPAPESHAGGPYPARYLTSEYDLSSIGARAGNARAAGLTRQEQTLRRAAEDLSLTPSPGGRRPGTTVFGSIAGWRADLRPETGRPGLARSLSARSNVAARFVFRGRTAVLMLCETPQQAVRAAVAKRVPEQAVARLDALDRPQDAAQIAASIRAAMRPHALLQRVAPDGGAVRPVHGTLAVATAGRLFVGHRGEGMAMLCGGQRMPTRLSVAGDGRVGVTSVELDQNRQRTLVVVSGAVERVMSAGDIYMTLEGAAQLDSGAQAKRLLEAALIRGAEERDAVVQVLPLEALAGTPRL